MVSTKKPGHYLGKDGKVHLVSPFVNDETEFTDPRDFQNYVNNRGSVPTSGGVLLKEQADGSIS